MMLNYEFPLFRYNFSFFKEEIAHLEIAVRDYVPPKDIRTGARLARSLIPFAETSTGRVLKCFQDANNWETGKEIASKAGVGAKGFTNHLGRLRQLGHQIDVRRGKYSNEYRLRKVL